LSAQAGEGHARVRRDHLLEERGGRAGRRRDAGDHQGRVRRARGRAAGGAVMAGGTPRSAGTGGGTGPDARKAAIRAILLDLAAVAEAAGLASTSRDIRDERVPKLEE